MRDVLAGQVVDPISSRFGMYKVQALLCGASLPSLIRIEKIILGQELIVLEGRKRFMTEKVNQQPHSSKSRISSRSKPKSSTANVGYTTIQPQRPITENRDAWHAYWQALNQPWRTEPEIDEMRQAYLAKRRNITPNKEQGISPFKDIKLSRADIEWLLATHEDGRGPVDWSDEQQRNRKGLDLAGADVRNANLSGVPL